MSRACNVEFCDSAESALRDVKNGDKLLVGGKIHKAKLTTTLIVVTLFPIIAMAKLHSLLSPFGFANFLP